MHIHQVPTDVSLTADQAWEEILEHGTRITYTDVDEGDNFTWETLVCHREDCADRP